MHVAWDFLYQILCLKSDISMKIECIMNIYFLIDPGVKMSTIHLLIEYGNDKIICVM